jgi:hypothetical protein
MVSNVPTTLARVLLLVQVLRTMLAPVPGVLVANDVLKQLKQTQLLLVHSRVAPVPGTNKK